VRPNEHIVKVWTFRNNGDYDWPVDAIFVQTNGDDLGALPVPLKAAVKVGEEVDIELPLRSPSLPGKYCAFFRFVHGDNQRFGQKVWCDILVEEEPQVFEQIANEMLQSQENASPLLNMSEQRVSSLLSEENSQEILQFENIEAKYEELGKVIEGSNQLVAEVEVAKQEEVEPLIKNAVSQVEEPVVVELQQMEEVKVEEPVEQVPEQKEEQEQELELTDEEKLRKSYLQELEAANLSDPAYIENLKYMMNMGYLNYRVNFNLLLRN
jgi:hypothetical protein